jgi:uncharacterized protein with PIN domain
VEIIELSIKDNRTILTKNREILKNNKVTHGYWIRNEDAVEQVKEVIRRFDLHKNIREFARCLECNSVLEQVEKEKVIERFPDKVKERHNEYWYCRKCDKIYWKGTHYDKMLELLNKINKEL